MKPFQVRESRYWYVQIRCSDGVRRPRSTSRTSAREAEHCGLLIQAVEDKNFGGDNSSGNGAAADPNSRP
jgi:hypothetical protein